MSSLLSCILNWQQQAAKAKVRLPIIWQGDEQCLLQNTANLLSEHVEKRLYWLGNGAPDNAITLNKKHNYQLLGSECDILVINAFSGFNADLVAASAGCVKAGGIWLLICPNFDIWRQQPNLAHKNLLSYPLDANLHQGNFIAFWINRASSHNIALLKNDNLEKAPIWPSFNEIESAVSPYASFEQKKAVDAILHVVSGHRRRPLVLTADRGRGKSAALGIAASMLAKQGKRIIITAPSPQAANTAIEHFSKLINNEQLTALNFMPYDELLKQLPNTDLLLIDEAAAIPTPVLQQLLKQYSRIVFATTEHGYEGTGRGFQLRFVKYLTETCPSWKKLHLNQPIRYQEHDALEKLIFDSFLLEHKEEAITYITNEHYQVNVFSNTDWLNKPAKLQQVFHLLSLAHYQTQIKDLAAILDNSRIKIITLEQNNNVLACALISIEGNIENWLANEIYLGKRRVQGHLLAQSLAFHLAMPELATLSIWRIMRIVVQPTLQRNGLGKSLLNEINHLALQDNIAYLGTSFGATYELINFWQQDGYQAIRLGSTIDKSSSEYSLLMLKNVLAERYTVNQLNQQFGYYLYLNLATNYKELDATLAVALAKALPYNLELSKRELEQLHMFCANTRPYELIETTLKLWFSLHSATLPIMLSCKLCSLFWQQLSLETYCKIYGFKHKDAAINDLKSSLQPYLD